MTLRSALCRLPPCAAAWPLTTAPSIVAGRPVSIQSPARNSPGTPRLGVRARRLAGRHRKRRALLADDDGAPNRRRRRPPAARPGPPSAPARSSSSFDRPTTALGAARHERQVRGLLAEQQSLVEHPLHRPAGQADERVVRDDAIEPEVHGDDRRGRRAAARRPRPRASGGGAFDEHVRERVPWDGADDGCGSRSVDLEYHVRGGPLRSASRAVSPRRI